MIKRFIPIIVAMLGFLTLFPSCQHEEQLTTGMVQEIPEGYVAVSFKASIPEMNQVKVRAVDPDGIMVHNNMVLFCFNEYGLFMSLVEAQFPDNYVEDDHGTFSAVIPQETHIIHFVANQNPQLLNEANYKNQTEDEVKSQMEGANGMMIYWARFESDNDLNTPIEDELKALGTNGNGIKLMHNQAKVSINDWNNQYLTVTGFVTTNVYAYGTTASYHPEKGYPTCNDEGFGTSDYWWNQTDFVTLPSPEKRIKLSDITGVNTATADYIFEHPNSLEDPVSVIIRGHLPDATEEKFYRVMLVDAQGQQLMIRRNHHYVITIDGALTYGQDTFEKALTAPATNNVWIAVDDWVNEVSDGTYSLAVGQTSAVYAQLGEHEDRNRIFTYKVTGTGLTDADKPTVTWLEGNTVADFSIGNEFNPATGEGRITITLKRDMGTNQELNGTLLVKKGNLQRKIAVSMIKTQYFTPAWIAAQVYGEETGEPVTLKFTIPETCPSELFPFTALVSTNSLDVRNASGIQLPVLSKGEEGYFGNDYWGYKYEYVVKGPGVHRIYFTNVQTHESNDPQKVYVEAPFFETLEKNLLYVSHQRTITLPHLHEMTPAGLTNVPSDELIRYVKVPQKKNAFVEFDMVLKDLSVNNSPAVNADEGDEFFIYSRSLEYYLDNNDGNNDNKITIGNNEITLDCNFGSVSEEIWSETDNGRVAAFHPITYEKTGENVGKYSIYMYTNRAVSEDVIRIASNVVGSKSYWNWTNKNNPVVNNSNDVTYQGNTYRSVIFELLNYHPFHFNAKVTGTDGSDNELHDSEDEEVVTDVSWDYDAPGKDIKITFDLAGFESDLHENEIIDPLGTEFRVFIDAPMLEAVTGQNNVSTLSDGRIVYTVPADAQLNSAVTISCKTKKITSAGEIKISSDKDVVVYYDKTFKISNNKIIGILKYRDGNQEKNVPKDAFVPFALKKNGTRIGSITMTDDGTYSLNLRSEYEFGWTTSSDHTIDNRIELNYKAPGGKVYDMVIHDLAKLKEMASNNEPIVLTEQDDSNLHNN